MATKSYQLDKVKNKNGKYTVRLIVRHRKTNSSLTTNVEVAKSDWLQKSQCIKSSVVGADQDNNTLADIKNKVQSAIIDLRSRNRLSLMKASEIIAYAEAFDANYSTEIGGGSFVDYWNSIAMLHPKSATKYKYALKKIVEFHIMVNGTDQIFLRDLTSEYIRTFIVFLKEVPYSPKGNMSKGYNVLSSNTIYTYTSTLKAVVNCAVDDGKISANTLKGFRKVAVQQPFKSSTFALSMEELRNILNCDLSAHSLSIQMARDLFIASFCYQGMNLIDLYGLCKNNIHGDVVAYIRSKTGKMLSVKIEYLEQLNARNERYLCRTNMWNEDYGTTNYIYAFYHHYRHYENFKSIIIKAIRKIRAIFNLPDKFVFYTARDTWATIASKDYNLGQEYIDAGLGHSSKSLAVNHYISIDNNKIYAVHNQMLAALFDKKIIEANNVL